MSHQKILILDFGSQYTQLIARRVRECQIYSEIHPYTLDLDKLAAMKTDFNIDFDDMGFTLYVILSRPNGEAVGAGADGRIVEYDGREWHDLGSYGGGKFSAIRAAGEAMAREAT